MSKKCKYRSCKCRSSYNRSCGFDPCRVALFLLVLNRAGIISPNTGIVLVLLFLLCCSGCGSQGICCGR